MATRCPWHVGCSSHARRALRRSSAARRHPLCDPKAWQRDGDALRSVEACGRRRGRTTAILTGLRYADLPVARRVKMPTWKALFDRVPLHEASFDFVLRLSAFKENAFVCDGRRENDFRWFLLLPRQVANAAPLGGLLPVQGETLSANAKPLSDSVVWQDVAFDLHLNV